MSLLPFALRLLHLQRGQFSRGLLHKHIATSLGFLWWLSGSLY